MIILGNAFSLNMLKGDATASFEQMAEEQVKAQLKDAEFVSAIGHASTATLLSSRLGLDVEEDGRGEAK